MTDKEIITGFLQGNASCVSLVSNWIRSTLRFHGGDNHLSLEDIAGDTMLKLFSLFQSNSFRHDSSLKTFVQSIARYTLIDAMRQRRFRLQYLTANAGVDSPDPVDVRKQTEQLDLVQRLVDLVGQNCRNLWKMIFFEGRSYKEIAELLNISGTAVKTRVFRCKEEAKALRKRLS